MIDLGRMKKILLQLFVLHFDVKHSYRKSAVRSYERRKMTPFIPPEKQLLCFFLSLFFFFLLLFSLPHQPPENKCSLLRGRCVLQAPLSSAACSFTYLPYFASSVSHCFRAADLGGYSCRLDPNPFTLSLTDPCAAQYIKKGKKNPLWDHPCV